MREILIAYLVFVKHGFMLQTFDMKILYPEIHAIDYQLQEYTINHLLISTLQGK